MKATKLWEIPLAAVLLFLAGPPVAFAQAGMGQGRPGARYYNPSTEVTVKGTVEQVREVTGRRRGWNGTHLTLRTAKETFDVHLGPSSFLAEKGFKFAKGDQIEVTGSKVKYNGAEALIARQVKKEGKTLVLRDARGIPEWSRGRRRN